MIKRLKTCKPVITLTNHVCSDSNTDFHETSKLFGYLASIPIDTSVKLFSLPSSENGFKLVIWWVYLMEGLACWSFQALVVRWAYLGWAYLWDSLSAEIYRMIQ